MAFSRKRQRFLVNQGYAYKVSYMLFLETSLIVNKNMNNKQFNTNDNKQNGDIL